MNGCFYSAYDIKKNAADLYNHIGISSMAANTHPDMILDRLANNTKHKNWALKLGQFITNSNN